MDTTIIAANKGIILKFFVIWTAKFNEVTNKVTSMIQNVESKKNESILINRRSSIIQ